jgi:hypothetical protein
MPVSEFLEMWLGNVRERVRATTYKGYECLLRCHVPPEVRPPAGWVCWLYAILTTERTRERTSHVEHAWRDECSPTHRVKRVELIDGNGRSVIT